MKSLLAAAVVIFASACTTVPEVQAMSHDCDAKYRAELPVGTVGAKPVTPMRVAPQRDRRSAYACVVATIDEHGRVTESRVVETDSPQFAEYFLKLVRSARYQPATLNGKPFAHETVLAASYE